VQTFLPLAAKNGSIMIVNKLLEQEIGVNSQDELGCSALYQAAYYGHFDIFKKLLNCGADINQKNHAGETPFFAASTQGNIRIILELLKKNVNPGLSTNDGSTPLLAAAKNGHLEVVKELIAQNCNVQSVRRTKNSEQTPLQLDLLYGHEKIADILIDAGADVKYSPGIYQLTPLHYAVKNGLVNQVTEIIKRGADVNAIGGEDKHTPLEEICRHYKTSGKEEKKAFIDILNILLDNVLTLKSIPILGKKITLGASAN
jgi:uncharacterized protein